VRRLFSPHVTNSSRQHRDPRALPVLLAGVLVGVLIGGCGGAEPGGSRGALDGADTLIDPPLEPIYTVGAMDGEEWETFGALRGIGFDDSGNLYLFDGDASEIIVIGLDGQHLGTFGKSGGGPGELQQPFAFTVFRDGTSAIFDLGPRAVQLFDPEGNFLRAVTFDPQEGLPGNELHAIGTESLVSTGGITIRSSAGSQAMSIGGADETRPIDRFSLDEGSKRVAYHAYRPPPAEGDESEVDLSDGDQRMQIRMSPLEAFQPGLHVGVLPDGRIVVVDSVGYRVKIVDEEGAVRTIERPILPAEGTDAIREREREVRLAALADQGGPRLVVLGGGGGADFGTDGMKKMMEDRITNMRFGPVVPVIAGLGVDWSDRIWVERSGEPGEEGPIDILGADGYYFGTILPGGTRIPDAFGPDGLLAYIDTDELGIERVRVVRIADDENLEGAAGN